ncbi:PQQ-binding-like beta-propeller repeat protein [Nocardiopsis sp. NPDC006198]|uniref:outer membrane protein assembly factor BamB family protein n=1 Tax=Nocardiopsis sp. NPDC006198 TaxID=3154472 RepID=UPI0033A97475
MRSPSHTVPALAAACVLALSACSGPDQDAPQAPEPSAISPDTVVLCQESDDCGQAGAVRWSRPLQGGFYLDRPQGFEHAPYLQPAGHWLDYGVPPTGAVEDDGVLYLHDVDTITAVDTATAATLWTEPVGVAVDELRMVGATLVALPAPVRGEVAPPRFLEVDREGAHMLESDLPQDMGAKVLASDDTHLALQESLPGTSDEDPRHFLVEAATGRVEWSVRLAWAGSHAVDEGTLYLGHSPLEGRHHIIAVRDGEQVADLDLPEEAGRRSDLWPSLAGPLLVEPYSCAPVEEHCEEDRITAVDPADGEVLWTHTALGNIVSVSDGDEPRVYVRDEDGYQALDADTGQVLAQDDEIEPSELLAAFGAQRPEPSEGMDEQDYNLLPFSPTGPGVEERPLEGLAAGAHHLTSYLAPDGGAVGVYTGCAPDGLRPPAMDAPVGDPMCAEPRVFAVDY